MKKLTTSLALDHLRAAQDKLLAYGIKSKHDLAYAVTKAAPQISMSGDVAFFATYYVRPYTHDWMAVPKAHEQVYEWLKKHNRLLLELPRDSGKSTIVSEIWPLYLICKDRNIRILHITGNADNGTKFAAKLKWHFEHNIKLINDFGKFKTRHSLWQTSQFTVNRTANYKDPTFRSMGWQSSMVGGRYDLVILDDVEDSRNAKTAEHGATKLQWLENDVLPMIKGGQMIVIQPYQGINDLHRTLRKKGIFVFHKIPAEDPKTGESIWKSRMPLQGHLETCPYIELSKEDFPCETCEHYIVNSKDKIMCGYCRDTGEMTCDHCVRCPIMDIPKIMCLKAKRKEVGSYNYRRQYLLDESVEAETLFPAKYFKNNSYTELPPGSYRIVHGYDLAAGIKDKGCEFGYARIYINNETGIIYVDCAEGFHYKMHQQMRLLETNQKNFQANTTCHGIESNAYQVAFHDYYAMLSTIPVKKVMTSQDKYTRAVKLTIFYETGRIKHREDACHRLQSQLENFEDNGLKNEKDIFDALYIALCADGIQGAGYLGRTRMNISYASDVATSRVEGEQFMGADDGLDPMFETDGFGGSDILKGFI